jgi:N-acetyl-gamma-glutamylphosphate reductase
MLKKIQKELEAKGYQPLSRYKVESFMIDYYEIWLNNKNMHTINIEVSKNNKVNIFSHIDNLSELK